MIGCRWFNKRREDREMQDRADRLAVITGLDREFINDEISGLNPVSAVARMDVIEAATRRLTVFLDEARSEPDGARRIFAVLGFDPADIPKFQADITGTFKTMRETIRSLGTENSRLVAAHWVFGRRGWEIIDEYQSR